MVIMHNIFSKLEKGASLLSLVFIASVSSFIVSGAEFYVDSRAEPGGTGTQASPFVTIPAAFHLAGEGDTILVRGGADRSYMVASEGDLVVVPASNITLRSYGGDGPAKVEISETLCEVTNNASVILVPTNATYFTVSGFDFTYFGSRGIANAGSLGNRGRVIDLFGDYATIEDCTFRQVGNYSSSKKDYTYNTPGGDKPDQMGHAAVATRAYQADKDKGRYLTVARCRFLGETEDRSMSAAIHGRDSVFSENIFSNCYYIVWPIKNCDTSFLFSSNILYRCRSIQAKCNSWQEWPNAEFAYNIFFSDAGGNAEPFFYKNGKHGLVGKKVFIHHNTLVNASHLALIAADSTISWQPQFFDNLILLDPKIATADATVFLNRQTAFVDGNFSSFGTDGVGCLKNNAWYAPGGISGGAAIAVEGYDLAKGCAITNNIVLDTWPTFMSMDLGSPNFMRPRASRNPTWATRGVAWTNAVSGCKTGLCDYIGAVEPLTSSPLIIHLR